MYKIFKIFSNKAKILISILSLFLILILVTTLPFIQKVYPNIYISKIYVGDNTKQDAIEKVSKHTIPEKIFLDFGKGTRELSTSEIVENVDINKTVERAYFYTNSGNFIVNIKNKTGLIFKPKDFGLSIQFDDKKLTEILLILSSEEGSPPTLPSAKILNNEIVIDAGKNGVSIDITKAANDIKSFLTNAGSGNVYVNLIQTNDALNTIEVAEYKVKLEKIIGKNLKLIFGQDVYTLTQDDLLTFFNPKNEINTTNLLEKISELSKKINRNPQDSVFIVENGKVIEFTPSSDGVVVDESKLLELLETYLDKITSENQNTYDIIIPVVKSFAKIRNEDVNNLGIDVLLGKGISFFKGSIPNRIHNINLAQSKFKGVLVPPDTTFSFNDILGDVSSYTGYKAAYVIKDGKTVLGDGGGVCQVSTTLFRAILATGLPIVERRAHSYRVGYYEQGSPVGLDATVYYPTTDLKFKNDTPAYLLIQPTIDNSSQTLVFEIYGTSDGRISTTSKPIITSSIAPAEDLYVDDPTLPTGTIRQIEHKAWGAKVVFNYKVERNGELLINQQFISNYRPWQAVYLKGTGSI